MNRKEDRVGSIAELTFETQSCSSLTKIQHEQNTVVGFGSVDFALEDEESGAKVPLQGPTSFAEFITMEGLALDFSDDSDWKFSYKFEE